MDSMFEECSSLISLPDISKWDTKNVLAMVAMFEECPSLISLTNISIWDTKNVKFESLILDDCFNLLNRAQFKRKYFKKLKIKFN